MTTPRLSTGRSRTRADGVGATLVTVLDVTVLDADLAILFFLLGHWFSRNGQGKASCGPRPPVPPSGKSGGGTGG